MMVPPHDRGELVTSDGRSVRSVDVVFDALRARLAIQLEQIKILDGKANFGLASASLLTAAVAGLRSSLATAQRAGEVEDWVIPNLLTVNPSTVVNVLVVAALGAYLAVVLTAYNAYRVRTFKWVLGSDDGPNEDFLAVYMDRPAVDTKEALSVAMSHAFKRNAQMVESKSRYVSLVLFSLIVEAFLLLLITVVQLAL